MNNGLVLCYEPSTGSLPPLTRGALAARGFRVKKVGHDDLGKTVGFLAGVSGETAAPENLPAPLAEPALIFCGVTQQGLDSALDALRRAKYFGLKAILTQTNQDWALGALLAELVKERAAINGGGSAHVGD